MSDQVAPNKIQIHRENIKGIESVASDLVGT